MDGKDNGMKMGNGAMGRNGLEGGNANGNGPVAHGEPQEGGFGVRAGYEQGLNQKAYGEAVNSPRMENGNLNGWDKNHTPKKSQKNVIIAVVLALVILAGVGIGIWCAISASNEKKDDDSSKVEDPDDSDDEEEPDDEKPTEAEIEAKKLADTQDITEKMKKALKEYLVTDDGTELFEFKDGNNATVLYRAADMEVAIPLVKTVGFTGNSVDGVSEEDMLPLWDKMNSEEYSKMIEKVFTENGFVKTGEDWTPLGEYVNWETGVICTNITSGMPIYFGCGHISWLDADEVALANELAGAYLAKEGKPLGSVSVKVADIENSSVAPYQRLDASIYGAVGLFYRVSPEAKWQFFMGTQSPLSCSDYNTEDLRKAFAGEVCYNESEESIVEP